MLSSVVIPNAIVTKTSINALSFSLRRSRQRDTYESVAKPFSSWVIIIFLLYTCGKKNRAAPFILSMQPDCLRFFKIRGFPSPPHDGFGFVCCCDVKCFLTSIRCYSTPSSIGYYCKKQTMEEYNKL